MGCVSSKPHSKFRGYDPLDSDQPRTTMSFSAIRIFRATSAPGKLPPTASSQAGLHSSRGEDGEDSELKLEIRNRQSSTVHTNVTRFEQLHVRANFPPVLRDIRHIERGGRTDVTVSMFEKLEKDANRKPLLNGAKLGTELRDSRIFDRVLCFEGMDRNARHNSARTLDSVKIERAQQEARLLHTNKLPVVLSTYSM